MNILADATLPGLTQAFPAPFCLSYYHHPEEIAPLLTGQDVLLCRSTLKINESLLKNHQLRYVATASSGTDHLDYQWLKSQKIQIIDAKGSNARSVADYIVSCLAYLQQQQLIYGYKAGIIGLGNVGSQVHKRLQAANFQILTYDPPKARQENFVFTNCMLEDLYQVDLLCIHAELHNTLPYPSSNLIDSDFLANLKPGCAIINAARGGIINEEALLRSKKTLTYCTDVYLNEPSIDRRIVDKATLCTPHIAGHSLEAKYAAVVMISEALHQIAGLAKPKLSIPDLEQILNWSQDKSWQEIVLSIYNPHEETQILKKSINKKSAFLEIRKNHQKRHDFLLYGNSILNEKTKLMLGK